MRLREQPGMAFYFFFSPLPPSLFTFSFNLSFFFFFFLSVLLDFIFSLTFSNLLVAPKELELEIDDGKKKVGRSRG